MKKKVLIGALALSATAVLGLTGCEEEIEIKRYTVTFDSDSAITTDNRVFEYTPGEIQLGNIPIPDEKDGFAGVWESFKLNDTNITVKAKYGDGTEANPYLVANAMQFKTILEQHTYDSIPETQTYFKLLADIDLDFLETFEYGGKYFSGVIDGNGYSIKNLSGEKFVSTEGSIFANIYDAQFKNLKVYLGNNIGTIAGNAKGGSNIFENVKIYNAPQINVTNVKADDNNESAFLNWVTGTDTVVSFVNCENYANYTIYSGYNGLFVGGYAMPNTTVNFIGCSNYGNIVSRGVVGMFFGNSYNKPSVCSISNCKFDGSIKSIAGSHILCAASNGNSGVFGADISSYDTNIVEKLEHVGTITGLDNEYQATISNSDIIVGLKSDDATELSMGSYQLVLSAYATENNGSTVLTNIVINKTIDEAGVATLNFDDCLYGMIDLESYNSQNGTSIKSSYATGYEEDGIEWIELEGYNIRYAVIDGNYVIDYTQYNNDMNYSGITINASVGSLIKTIAVTNGDSIDFIVNFS